MALTVQSRFDEKAQTALERLNRLHGWSTSQTLRECVLRMSEQSAETARPRLIGIGSVDFGPGDLATNKLHLKSLGVKSMGKGRRPANGRAR